MDNWYILDVHCSIYLMTTGVICMCMCEESFRTYGEELVRVA